MTPSTCSASASTMSLVEPGTGMEMPSVERIVLCLCSSTSSTVSSIRLSVPQQVTTLTSGSDCP